MSKRRTRTYNVPKHLRPHGAKIDADSDSSGSDVSSSEDEVEDEEDDEISIGGRVSEKLDTAFGPWYIRRNHCWPNKRNRNETWGGPSELSGVWQAARCLYGAGEPSWA